MTDTEAARLALLQRLRGELNGLQRRWRELLDTAAFDRHPREPRHAAYDGPLPSWSVPLASPLTIGQALDLVGQHADAIVERALKNLDAGLELFVLPEARAVTLRTILRKQDVGIGRWPWPTPRLPVPQDVILRPEDQEEMEGGVLSPEQAAMTLLSCFARYMIDPGTENEAPPTLPGSDWWWPPHTTYQDVVLWAVQRMNAHVESARYPEGNPSGLLLAAWSQDNAARLKEGRPPLGFHARLPDGRWYTVDRSSYPILYLAEKAASLGAPGTLPSHAPVDMGPVPVRMAGLLAGASPEDMKPAGRIGKHRIEPILRVKWEGDPEGDGTVGHQLDLPLWGDPTNIMLYIQRRYGDAAVRNLLALYLFAWTSRTPTGESFWWWPEEHLDLVGLASSKENRAALRSWLENMKGGVLTVQYADDMKITAPIVASTAFAEGAGGTALRLHLHPALCRNLPGSKDSDGFWLPVPLALFRLDAKGTHGKPHPAAFVLGRMFRASLKDGAIGSVRIGVELLARRLGISYRTDRVKDPRAAETVRKTLESLRSAGFIESADLERGTLEGNGLLVIRPGRLALDAALSRPRWIPATVGDFKAWMHETGFSSIELEGMIGVPASTIRWAKRGPPERPLPTVLRAALRSYLWGG